jgi:hypothetical protein
MHDAVAYSLVRAGAKLDVKNKEGTEPLLFPSETFAKVLNSMLFLLYVCFLLLLSFKIIIVVHKYGDACPPTLVDFLEANADTVAKIASTEEDKKELVDLHALYVDDVEKGKNKQYFFKSF